MSIYSERVDAADFPGRVAKIRHRIGEIDDPNRERIADLGEPDLIERLEVLLDHLLVVVSSTPPEVVTQRFIDATAGLLDAVYGDLEEMLEDATEADVRSVATQVEALADDLLTWPAGAGEKEVTQAATTYRRSLGQQLVSARDELRDLEGEIAALRTAVEATRTSSQTSSEEATTASRNAVNEIEQRVAVVATRVEALEAQAESALARTNNAVERFEQQFSNTQAERTAKHDAQLAQQSADFDAAVKALEEQAREGLEVINENVAESGDLVTLFASAGTGNAYSEEATTQAAQAGLWRRVAVGLALFTVALTALVLFLDGDENDVGIVTGRVALVFALGGLTAYAAKQSGRHRHREEVARRLALDIVAFGPFTKDLDAVKQDEARLDLSKRIFGQENGNGPAAPALSDGHINLLSRIIDVIPKSK